MKNKIAIGAIVVVILLIAILVMTRTKSAASGEILTTVQRGPFKVEIETTGELEAKNSVKILGPTALREFRIYQITIQSIVDEGTLVNKGDMVATLDRSEFQNRFSEKQIELNERMLSMSKPNWIQHWNCAKHVMNSSTLDIPLKRKK